MKNKCILFAVMMCASVVFAQKSNLILFTEQGEKFSVILNGVLQNEKPETNVKVTDLIAPSYKLKIIFQDATKGSLDKNIFFNTQGVEATYSIKMNTKGEYVVRYQNEVPIAQALPPASGQSIVIFSATGPSAPVGTTTVSQTTTTTTNAVPVEGASMGIHVNDPDLGVNFNLNLNAGNTNVSGTSSTTSYSTTTTTTTTSGNVPPPPPPPTPPAPAPYSLPGYSGPVGCPYPMSSTDFNAAKSSISSKSFEDSKLSIAKQVFNTNCLLSSQVKEIMMLFSFEDTKLDFAKYAYGRTFDIGNYFKVNDAFTFESSIEELNTYISGYTK